MNALCMPISLLHRLRSWSVLAGHTSAFGGPARLGQAPARMSSAGRLRRPTPPLLRADACPSLIGSERSCTPSGAHQLAGRDRLAVAALVAPTLLADRRGWGTPSGARQLAGGIRTAGAPRSGVKEELAAIGSRGGQPLRGVPAGLILEKRSRSAECLPAWSWRSAAALRSACRPGPEEAQPRNRPVRPSGSAARPPAVTQPPVASRSVPLLPRRRCRPSNRCGSATPMPGSPGRPALRPCRARPAPCVPR